MTAPSARWLIFRYCSIVVTIVFDMDFTTTQSKIGCAVRVFVRNGGKCERCAFCFEPKKNVCFSVISHKGESKKYIKPLNMTWSEINRWDIASWLERLTAKCTSCNGPGFDPSIRRHSGIRVAADEAMLNIVWKKIPPKSILKKEINRNKWSENFSLSQTPLNRPK